MTCEAGGRRHISGEEAGGGGGVEEEVDDWLGSGGADLRRGVGPEGRRPRYLAIFSHVASSSVLLPHVGVSDRGATPHQGQASRQRAEAEPHRRPPEVLRCLPQHCFREITYHSGPTPALVDCTSPDCALSDHTTLLSSTSAPHLFVTYVRKEREHVPA